MTSLTWASGRPVRHQRSERHRRREGDTVYRGTVLRLLITIPPFGLPCFLFGTTIGSGFPENLDPAALVIGPTGVGLGPNGALYVADTLANRIAGIPNAALRFSDGHGLTVSRGHP